jgi:hypothetical protein
MKTRIILFFITLAMGICHKNFGQLPTDLLSFHPNFWKSRHKDLSFFYDQENLSLKYGNDTLEVFVLGNKKWLIGGMISKDRRISMGGMGLRLILGFLMEMIEKLELNFTANNFEIVFSPESKKNKDQNPS